MPALGDGRARPSMSCIMALCMIGRPADQRGAGARCVRVRRQAATLFPARRFPASMEELFQSPDAVAGFRQRGGGGAGHRAGDDRGDAARAVAVRQRRVPAGRHSRASGRQGEGAAAARPLARRRARIRAGGRRIAHRRRADLGRDRPARRDRRAAHAAELFPAKRDRQGRGARRACGCRAARRR